MEMMETKKKKKGRQIHILVQPWRLGTVSLTDIISDVYLFMLTTVASDMEHKQSNPLQQPEQQEQQYEPWLSGQELAS